MWTHNISEQHKRAGGISPPDGKPTHFVPQRGANAPRSLEKGSTKSSTPLRHCAALFVNVEQKPECIVIKGDSVNRKCTTLHCAANLTPLPQHEESSPSADTCPAAVTSPPPSARSAEHVHEKPEKYAPPPPMCTNNRSLNRNAI